MFDYTESLWESTLGWVLDNPRLALSCCVVLFMIFQGIDMIVGERVYVGNYVIKEQKVDVVHTPGYYDDDGDWVPGHDTYYYRVFLKQTGDRGFLDVTVTKENFYSYAVNDTVDVSKIVGGISGWSYSYKMHGYYERNWKNAFWTYNF